MTAPVHWLGARATAAFRPLPDFLIIGAQKAGTTSLATYLFKHPDVAPPIRKEVHYFDSPEFANGPGWYRAHFPFDANGMMTGEASPYYFAHPHCPRRVAELLPAVKIILMLRDPVDRALSHYHHQVRHGRESLSFEDALKAEPDRLAGELERMLADETYYSHNFWAFSYLARSRYGEQIARWLDCFPLDQFLIVKSESFYEDPATEYSRALEFLGLSACSLDSYDKKNAGRYSSIAPHLRSSIESQLALDQQLLRERTGLHLGWNGSLP